jgi:hypothetical protein
MGEAEVRRASIGIPKSKCNGTHKSFDPSFLVQLPNKLQDCIKVSFFPSMLDKLAF